MLPVILTGDRVSIKATREPIAFGSFWTKFVNSVSGTKSLWSSAIDISARRRFPSYKNNEDSVRSIEAYHIEVLKQQLDDAL